MFQRKINTSHSLVGVRLRVAPRLCYIRNFHSHYRVGKTHYRYRKVLYRNRNFHYFFSKTYFSNNKPIIPFSDILQVIYLGFFSGTASSALLKYIRSLLLFLSCIYKKTLITYLIKLVYVFCSFFGGSIMPAVASFIFSSQAIFLPNTLIICLPSSSL